ncbi:3-deoxy-7-phosphoheptulonate synthase [Lentzea sp. NBRC 105346]|uniref:3-deoxy-7-phosphoheptulonate synthase n=1 Tax=Lentzea sp. NBRC 105346 TaxID=3032205 RepID=UPI0024A49C27|nr:3-deoxy-7-phosphoheptulonate synthase [Lentzea sp. NBRC 105346]GLZ35197.1 3-deoxy-7-phosphoheptulonate synthase [Lentzea sp. NBRC 105346]
MIVIMLSEACAPVDRRRIIDTVQFAGTGLRVHTPALLSLSGDHKKIAALLADEPCVLDVAKLPAAYPRSARLKGRPRTTPVPLGNADVGEDFTVIAGPCSVENRSQLLTIAGAVKAAGAHALRAGAFKPRTSPYSFHGLGVPGLRLLAEARELTGLPVVTEVVDVRDIEVVAEHVDMIQIGARNMQNYTLLREAGRTRVPVLMKRGLSASVDETLLASEYLLDGGNEQVVLCERGIRTFESSYRFTLDLGAVAVLKERTHLPVIVDPSHAAGASGRVVPLALAAAAVGADGIIVESHHDPAAALCDGAQALPVGDLPDLMSRLVHACTAAGRSLRFETGDQVRGGGLLDRVHS